MKRELIPGNKPATPGRRRSGNTGGAPSGLPRFLKPSGGKPLEPSVRSAAEQAYGRDLKEIRVHTDSEAAEAADSLDARAYASGRDLVFGAGEYAPGTSAGWHLIAHELAHAVQQSNGAASGLSQPSDTYEAAADLAADRVLRGENAVLDAAATAPSIQRQALPKLKPPETLARALGSGSVDSFPTGGHALSAAQKASVASLAAQILSLRDSYPGCSVQVTGHTDAVGTEASNMTLGQARADAVSAELALSGVPPEIIAADSAGETQLKVQSNSAEPRNRRVEIQFEPQAGPSKAQSPEVLPTAPKLEMPMLPPPPPPVLPKIPPPVYAPPQPETPAERSRRIFAPVPPDPRKPADPLFGPILHKVDSLLKSMNLPDWARDAVRGGVKAAIVKGGTAAADAAMDRTSMTADEKRAIHSAVEAAITGQLPK